MGVGDPVSVVQAIGVGVDMFDCVLPTRLGRHGSALTSAGRLHIKAARYAKDDSAMDPGCHCPVCRRHTKAYIRHLYNVGEPSAGRLVSLHNLAWLTGLVAEPGGRRGQFSAFANEVFSVWGARAVPNAALSDVVLEKAAALGALAGSKVGCSRVGRPTRYDEGTY